MTRDWLETNRLWGFASSTVAGLNTRRYHGLLVELVRAFVGARYSAEARHARRLEKVRALETRR